MVLMDTIAETDEALACQARAGSSESFELLVRRYQVPLLRFLQRRAPGRQDHEDVIQDAFLRAYQSLERYRENQPFKPWLFTIAYRVSIDARRHRWPMPMENAFTASNDETGPLLQMSDREEKEQLWAVTRRVLNEEAFTAVWLFYGESMPTEQIAEVMARSRDWVKTTLLRSRAKIKVALTESET